MKWNEACSTSSFTEPHLLIVYGKTDLQYRRGSARLLAVYTKTLNLSLRRSQITEKLQNFNQHLISLVVSCYYFWFHFVITIVCSLCSSVHAGRSTLLWGGRAKCEWNLHTHDSLRHLYFINVNLYCLLMIKWFYQDGITTYGMYINTRCSRDKWKIFLLKRINFIRVWLPHPSVVFLFSLLPSFPIG